MLQGWNHKTKWIEPINLRLKVGAAAVEQIEPWRESPSR